MADHRSAREEGKPKCAFKAIVCATSFNISLVKSHDQFKVKGQRSSLYHIEDSKVENYSITEGSEDQE